MGRNGVGKTTMLNSLMGIVDFNGGEIWLEGKNITGAKSYQINQSGISMVPEGRWIFANLMVLENLQLVMRPGGATLEAVYELFPRL